MAEIYIPRLHSFAMDNSFSGSFGDLRFMITPTVVKCENNPKEVDMVQSSILVEFWHGPLCREKSQIEGTQTFPMSEEGRARLLAWLESNV